MSVQEMKAKRKNTNPSKAYTVVQQTTGEVAIRAPEGLCTRQLVQATILRGVGITCLHAITRVRGTRGANDLRRDAHLDWDVARVVSL